MPGISGFTPTTPVLPALRFQRQSATGTPIQSTPPIRSQDRTHFGQSRTLSMRSFLQEALERPQLLKTAAQYMLDVIEWKGVSTRAIDGQEVPVYRIFEQEPALADSAVELAKFVDALKKMARQPERNRPIILVDQRQFSDHGPRIPNRVSMVLDILRRETQEYARYSEGGTRYGYAELEPVPPAAWPIWDIPEPPKVQNRNPLALLPKEAQDAILKEARRNADFEFADRAGSFLHGSSQSSWMASLKQVLQSNGWLDVIGQYVAIQPVESPFITSHLNDLSIHEIYDQTARQEVNPDELVIWQTTPSHLEDLRRRDDMRAIINRAVVINL